MTKKRNPWSFTIEKYSKKPKYLQIVDAVKGGVQKGEIDALSQLPSVNMLLKTHDLSRDTVVKAYNRLKSLNIVESVPGKGYYVKNVAENGSRKVLLIFNKLSQHKKIIFDAFVQHLGEYIRVDLYIYNNDFRLFQSLLEPRLEENYSAYVIIGHFLKGGLNAIDVINKIPKDKLIVLDKNIRGIRGNYASVYQDFESDILQVLNQATPKILAYQRMKIIFPSYTYQPKEIVSGFIKYCSEKRIEYEVVKDLMTYVVEKGTVYVVTMEDDLVTLIKKIKEQGFTAGSDVGIISYNETPLKEILLDGITTISTDFEQLGTSAAALVLNGEKEHIKNPFYINFRNSL